MAFFAARQPILDINKKVYGYELLFRSGSDNVFPDVDQEKATSNMVESLQFNLGLDKISSGKYAFINFTENAILSHYPKMLPKEKIVIEVLETVNPSKEVIDELEALSKIGYKIALDDYVHSSAWEPVYQFCDFLKIDCQNIKVSQLKLITSLRKRFPHIKLLAEKVETYDEYKRFLSHGFEYFQGYFFSKPEVMRSVSMSTSHAILSELLSEVMKESINISKVTKLFESDVGMSYKLLRYTQSPLFQRRQKIENIRQALIMLGETEIQRFVMFLVAAAFGENKPSELIRLSIHRAKFCEQLSIVTSKHDHIASAFLVGMLSLIDAMLDADINKVIGEMHLSKTIEEALLAQSGWLAEAIQICQIIEIGQWERIDATCTTLNMEYADLIKAYDEAGQWANERVEFIL